jgi:non-ribosomal peptide synthetase component E (peptide arylation enzyme)
METIMPQYDIEQYELHSQRYAVEAASEAEAIQKLLAGEAEAIDDTLELIEVADEYGMLVAENPELAAALRALGVEVGETVIPSIRNVEEVW